MQGTHHYLEELVSSLKATSNNSNMREMQRNNTDIIEQYWHPVDFKRCHAWGFLVIFFVYLFDRLGAFFFCKEVFFSVKKCLF